MSDFIMSSGLNVAMPAMPIPDLAEPIAAATHDKIIDDAQPAKPRKGAKWGAKSVLALMRSI